MNVAVVVVAGVVTRFCRRVLASTLPIVVTALVTGATLAATNVEAQARARSSSGASIGEALDGWIVTRYRGAQLLEDSSAARVTVLADAPVPRVEHVRDAKGDSLVGVHFSERIVAPSLTQSSDVRLAVPSGAVTSMTGRVVARRLFRAPRVPAATNNTPSSWRYGWAYLVVLPRQRDALPAQAMRGWLLVDGTSQDKRTRRSRP